MHHTALSGSGWKQRGEGCQQSLMPIGDDQVDLGRPAIAQVLSEATPAIFVFFGTGPQCEHLLVAFQVHTKGS